MNFNSFIALTAHFIGKDWTIYSCVVDFIPFKGEHSGANLAGAVYNTLKDLNCTDRVLTFTMDNAANMDTFATSLSDRLLYDGIKWDNHSFRMRCFPHILNLAVQSVMFWNTQPKTLATLPVVQKAQALATWCRGNNSSQRIQKLEEMCNISNIDFVKPILSVSTRWNSAWAMMKTLLRLQKVFDVNISFIYCRPFFHCVVFIPS